MESSTATSKRFRKRTGVWRLRGPLVDDPTATVLHAALVGLLLWLAIYTAAFYPFIAAGRFAGVLLSISMAFVCLISLALLKRGLLRPATLVCTVGGWLVASSLIVISGGIHSPALVIYIAFPVSVVWLMGYGAALVSAGACAANVLVMAWMDTGGALWHVMDHLEIWSVFLLAAFIAAVPLTQVFRGFTEALALARQQIEELRRAEEELRSLSKFPEENPNPVLRISREGKILYGNRAGAPLLRLFDRQVGQPLPESWRELVATAHASQNVQEVEAEAEGRIFLCTVAAIPGEDYVSVYAIDITQRRRTREALRRSEEELRHVNEELEHRVEIRTGELEDARRVALSMLQDADIQRRNTEEVLKKLAESTSSLVMLWQAVENSPAVVVITDTEANIQYVNPKFTEVTGYSAEEVMGKNPRILKSGEHPLEFYQHLWTTVKAGKTWFGEFCNRKKNGELYWEAASISPVRASDGRVQQFLAIKEDVTEIKHAAEELRLAKDAADAANRAKGVFLASMSHEIRTPLNAILGYSQLMLRDDSLGPGSRESLQVINRSGEHLLALINNVLEVSKIEAGQVGLEPAEFDMHTMLNDLAAMFSLPAKEKGIGFEVTKANGLPRYVIADEGKTRQVLVNLLGNAVKFTKQGHVKVGAAVTRAETGQLWLGVEVEDTGAGIAPEEMGRLFQYFGQTQSGRETQSGTGLGLVISRDYARRMGGDISVASEPGKGTVFCFELPIALGAAKPAGELPDGRRVTGLAPGQAPLRVLVADDQDTNRGWVRALLESVGFEVHEAGNGQEALEIWQAWRPQLILMDMRMPLMDGYEATRRIRSAPGGDSTVIIALTASTLDERMEAMMNAGVDDLVCKPFKEGLLFDQIRTHLGVTYRYEESEELAKARPGEPLFATAIPLPGLPAELLVCMRQAILGCDMDGFIRLLPQVAEQYPSVAVSLRTLAEKYDYDALARIVSESQ